MKQTVEMIAPVWGQFTGGSSYGNWDIMAANIQCRADADGACVYVFSGIGDMGKISVLAHDIESAWHAVSEDYIKMLEREIKALHRQLDDLEREADDIYCEIDDVNDDISALRKRIADTLALKPLQLQPEPEHLQTHPRLFQEVQA